LQDPKDAPACKISCNNVIVLAITVITSVNKMKIHLHPTLEDLKWLNFSFYHLEINLSLNYCQFQESEKHICIYDVNSGAIAAL
jgi:hypothetical protein